MTPLALRFQPYRAAFAAPVASYKQWLVIVTVALVFLLMPQLPNNDWQRNASGLPHGLSLYQDPAYVYPPWALVLMFPYYLMTAAGARVASVLVIGWLAQRRGWSLAQFLSVVLAPLFLWTMVLSSADVMILLIPLLLWDVDNRWQPMLRGLALAILLLKPQVTLLLLLYWLWTLRNQPRHLLSVLAVMVAITLPISMIGSSPLLAQWLANILRPSTENLDFWTSNNLSLSYRYGVVFAIAVVLVAFGGLYLFLRKCWQRDYSVSAALATCMLLAPYASNQSAIVPLALRPSWRVTLLQYLVVFGAAILNAYAFVDDWLLLSLVILSIVFAARRDRVPLLAEQVEG